VKLSKRAVTEGGACVTSHYQSGGSVFGSWASSITLITLHHQSTKSMRRRLPEGAECQASWQTMPGSHHQPCDGLDGLSGAIWVPEHKCIPVEQLEHITGSVIDRNRCAMRGRSVTRCCWIHLSCNDHVQCIGIDAQRGGGPSQKDSGHFLGSACRPRLHLCLDLQVTK
jgi:hypothetical protein